MNFIFGKALLSLLFYTDNPYFLSTFSKFLSLLFPYFSGDGHLKAWRKYVHEVLVKPLSQTCPGKRVVRLTDRLNMTITVDWDVKPQTKQTDLVIFKLHI